ncbi:14262_t:CDS:2, partial [Racocetra persica]
ITDTLDAVYNSIQDVTKNLRLICSSLRDICDDNTAVFKEFINFWHKILKYTLVYYKEIFLLIKEATIEIKKFMENFITLSSEEFLNEINFFVKDHEKNSVVIHFKKLESSTQSFKKLIESLIILIEKYISSLSSIVQSFITLKNELKKISSNAKNYYIICNDKAQSVINNCTSCIYKISGYEANLDRVPFSAANNYIRS